MNATADVESIPVENATLFAAGPAAPQRRIQPRQLELPSPLDVTVGVSLDSNGQVTLTVDGDGHGVTGGFNTLAIPFGMFRITFILSSVTLEYADPAVLIFPVLGPGMGSGNQVIAFGAPPTSGTTAIATFMNFLPHDNRQQLYNLAFAFKNLLTEVDAAMIVDPTIINTPDPG
jgi:hypothetical protein